MTADDNSNARVETNKATLRRMLERLNAGDMAGFIAGLAPDYVRHHSILQF